MIRGGASPGLALNVPLVIAAKREATVARRSAVRDEGVGPPTLVAGVGFTAGVGVGAGSRLSAAAASASASATISAAGDISALAAGAGASSFDAIAGRVTRRRTGAGFLAPLSSAVGAGFGGGRVAVGTGFTTVGVLPMIQAGSIAFSRSSSSRPALPMR